MHQGCGLVFSVAVVPVVVPVDSVGVEPTVVPVDSVGVVPVGTVGVVLGSVPG